MRRYNCGQFAAAAGAFGLGVLLAITCSFKLALFLAVVMLLAVCWSSLRWR